MSQQTIRQQARAAARDMAQRRRRERAERDRRLEDLAVLVLTAIGERDVAVAAAEQRAGAALREMIEVEGLNLSEAVAWCDERVSLREATRLRRLVEGGDPASSDAPAAVTSGDASGDAGAAQAPR
ncbi:hypothetical protein BSP109_02184 [Brevibacterium sp. Mu109]|uniref:hypothetical protein n=1 Tax=Brevibacterium sp. Mu109 TaxID=1255669 RepID=UPI000C4BAD2E|nr:hypothetical protein [Brevibacterium sp. Mu109]SMX87176.1 hypothetical protein BSP109_02184 [Brevibacterium sp. Mu109]